ncbi:MAG: chemotaxis protein CheW [Saccharospirillaceae bacterium]|nr:chemotaxis protein CheW [Saccharospirillaceae bacterium]
MLRSFDEPHKRIHALADELLNMRDNGQREAALAILHEHENNTLQRLRDLFAEVRSMVRSSIRPTVIMVQSNEQQTLGLRVDDVGEVFSCHATQQENEQQDYMPPFARGWLKGIRIAGQEVTIMEINPQRLLSSIATNEGQLLA